MTNILDIKDKYIDLYHKNKSLLPGNNLEWLNKIREDDISQFKLYGIPNTNVEEWRSYSYKYLTKNYYSLSLKEGDLNGLPNIEERDFNCSLRIVFSNGKMIRVDCDEIPAGIKINSLKYFIKNHPELIKNDIKSVNHYLDPRLSQTLDIKSQSLVSLNSAFYEDGAVIYVDKNIEVPGYIEIIYLDSIEDNSMYHMRSIVNLDEGAKCNIIERTINSNNKNKLFFSSKVTNINLSKNSSLSLMRLIEGNLDNTHINNLYAELDEDATLNNSSFVFSKGESREEIRVRMQGQGSNANIDGLILGGKKSKNEILTKVSHLNKNSKSNQNIRIVLDDESRGAFQGKIRVDKGANKTMANMSGKSLLLDKLARVYTKPELEILADDVICSHGLTVGNIDKEQLFYLCSRGISKKEAEKILIEAFSKIIIENLSNLFKEKAEKRIIEYYEKK